MGGRKMLNFLGWLGRFFVSAKHLFSRHSILWGPMVLGFGLSQPVILAAGLPGREAIQMAASFALWFISGMIVRGWMSPARGRRVLRRRRDRGGGPTLEALSIKGGLLRFCTACGRPADPRFHDTNGRCVDVTRNRC